MNEWVRLAAFGSLLGRREGSSNRRVEMRTAIESHARETKLENRSTQATLNLCADGVESRASSGSIYLALTYFIQSVQFNVDDENENSTALGHLLPRFAALEEKNTRPKNFHSAGNFKKGSQSMSSSLSLNVPLGLALQ